MDPSKESIPFVSSLEKKSIPSKDFLKDGDVIIADTAEDATVGKCTEIVNSNGYSLGSGLHTFSIRPRKAFGKGYLGFYMNSNSYHNQLVPNMQGIKVTSLSRSAMLNTTIAYPKDISEQEKIGGAFFQIDSLLSLHQRSWTTDPCSNKPGQRSHDQIDVFVLELLDDVEVGSLGCVHG